MRARGLFISWVLAVALLASCTTAPYPDPMSASMELSYLALGDSYTIGQGVAESERFPVQLADRLRASGLPMADPEIIARTGWTTRDLINATADGPQRESYDLLTLLIGVNDQFGGYSIDQYEQDFADILATAIQLAGGDPSRVVVLSIPDWGVTPAGAGYSPGRIAAEIDAFNAVNRRLSEAAGVAYFDITPISRRAAAQDGLVAGDGLHPSGAMYSLWVEAIYEYVLELLATAG